MPSLLIRAWIPQRRLYSTVLVELRRKRGRAICNRLSSVTRFSRLPWLSEVYGSPASQRREEVLFIYRRHVDVILLFTDDYVCGWLVVVKAMPAQVISVNWQVTGPRKACVLGRSADLAADLLMLNFVFSALNCVCSCNSYWYRCQVRSECGGSILWSSGRAFAAHRFARVQCCLLSFCFSVRPLTLSPCCPLTACTCLCVTLSV